MKVEKGLLVLFIVFTVLFVADAVSTMINYDFLKYMETNPVFMITKSFLPVIAMNILVCIVMAGIYIKGSIFWRYTTISQVVWLSVLRISAIINNVKVYLNPPTITQMQSITTAVKVAQTQTLLLAFFMPLIISVLIYLLFLIDHQVQKKQSLKD